MTIEYKDSKRITTSSNEYKVHSFTTTGNSTFAVTGSGDVEYLVIGGGGGGGYNQAGGGGAGGYRTGTGFAVTAQNYTITVGAGGAGSSSGNGTVGNDSVFSTITSDGGGYGATNTNTGGSGGSGGGAGAGGTGGSATSGQGNDGGSGITNVNGGGGGGSSSTETTPTGGLGTSSSITGSTVSRAGGGGGGNGQGSGSGGSGTSGGGNGGYNSNGTAGTVNTGSGGGGGGNSGSAAYSGGAGGSGIVIIRYLTSSGITATGGTITTVTEEQSKPTDVQDNSILVEKDTARRYWFSEVETHTDTFDGVGWAETGSQYTIDTANNEIDYVVKRDGSDHYVNKDLQNSNSVGSNLSDDYFRVRWHMANSGYSTGSTNCSSYIGVRSVTGASSDSQDALVFKITSGDANTIAPKYSNGTDIESGTNGSTALSGLNASLDKYFEIERTSPTSVTFRIFPNDTYGTADNEQTFTISSSYTGFRYFSMMTRSSSSQSPTMTGSFDGLEIISGTATWTMPPTFQDDFSSYSDDQAAADLVWVSNDTGDFRVNVTNDNLAYDSKVTGTTNQGIYYDFGTALSDTAWVLDFKMVISTLTLYSGGSVGAATYITMNNSGTGGAIGGSVDAIGFYMSSTATGGRFTMTNADSSPLNIAGGTLNTINATGTYYVRIIRLTPDSMRLELHNDPARTASSLIEGQTKTGISSDITGLKYFRLQDNQSVAGTGTGQNVGTIDDIKIYNGVTTPN